MNASVCTVLALVTAATLAPAAVARDSAKEQIELRRVAFKYAACVVRKHHDQVSAAILGLVGNGEIVNKFSDILDSECLGAAAGTGFDMRFPADTYKFELADALVNADFATHGETSFANRLPLAQPAIISEADQATRLTQVKGDRKRKAVIDDNARDNARAWLLLYGECVVRHDPVNTRYWLLTPPETPEEMSRIKALQLAFGDCLENGTAKFSRLMMRGTVAINYYRLAMATVVPDAGSAH